MPDLKVVYRNENNEKIEGILLEANLKESKIQTANNEIIKVDSELVALKDVKVDKEYAIQWLNIMAEHYQGAEITDVEKEEINRVVAFIEKNLNNKKEN